MPLRPTRSLMWLSGSFRARDHTRWMDKSDARCRMGRFTAHWSDYLPMFVATVPEVGRGQRNSGYWRTRLSCAHTPVCLGSRGSLISESWLDLVVVHNSQALYQ